MRLSFYSMSRETGLAAVLKAGDSTSPIQAVKDALGRGEATLEKVLALVTKSGQRAVAEETSSGVTRPISNTPTAIRFVKRAVSSR